MARHVPILFLAMAASSTAFAQNTEAFGIPVKVAVVDSAGKPIPTAWVRLPNTEGRRRVDPDGTWTAAFVYRTDGTELDFAKGMVLEFTVSAPGYTARTVAYKVARRKNSITVPLEPMLDPDFSDEDDTQLIEDWIQKDNPNGPGLTPPVEEGGDH
jgi:hypothetical protein